VGKGSADAVGIGIAVGDGTGTAGLVGLAALDGGVGVGAAVVPLSAGPAAGGEAASCRASAMIRADSGASGRLVWPS